MVRMIDVAVLQARVARKMQKNYYPPKSKGFFEGKVKCNHE